MTMTMPMCFLSWKSFENKERNPVMCKECTKIVTISKKLKLRG